MSAQLASANSFSAHLALAAGVSVSINAPTLGDLQKVVEKLHPAANDTPATAKADAGKAPRPPASTPTPPSTPASAPAAESGSAPADDAARPTYNDIRDRVLALAKVSRETAMGALGKFKGMKGEPVDHGNKLKLEDYAAFLADTDALVAADA